MKYFLVFFCITALPAFSQSIIPKIGLSASTINMGPGFVGPEYKTENKIGIVAGAEGQFIIHEKLNCIVSLLYSQSGWKGNGKFNTVDYEDDIRLDYLVLSVMPSLKLSPFYLMVGPTMGIATGGRSVQTLYYINGPIIQKVEPSFPHKINFGAQLVAGIMIQKRVLVDIRYQKSFTNYFDAIDDTPSKLTSLQLTTGFLIEKRN